jgi:hypothetical protein
MAAAARMREAGRLQIMRDATFQDDALFKASGVCVRASVFQARDVYGVCNGVCLRACMFCASVNGGRM